MKRDIPQSGSGGLVKGEVNGKIQWAPRNRNSTIGPRLNLQWHIKIDGNLVRPGLQLYIF